MWNVSCWMNITNDTGIPTIATRPSYNPTILPAKQRSNYPSAIPTLMATNEATIKTYCEDITWITITGDDTDESGTLS